MVRSFFDKLRHFRHFARLKETDQPSECGGSIKANPLQIMKNILSLDLLLFGLCIAPPSHAQPAYHFLKEISIPGDGGWDYL
jgi:hypothetical protein